MPDTVYRGHDCTILFFILVFLLLFYDSSAIGMFARRGAGTCGNDCTILFFILVFLELFWK